MSRGPRLRVVGHVAKLDVVVGGDLDRPGMVLGAVPGRVAAKVFLPRPSVLGRQAAEAESGADGACLSSPEQMDGRCAAHDDDNGAFKDPRDDSQPRLLLQITRDSSTYVTSSAFAKLDELPPVCAF